MSEILELFKRKEKLFTDMLEYIQRETFTYTEDDVQGFKRFVNNLNVYMRSIGEIQEKINNFDKSLISADKEVCAIEEKCKLMARKIYDIDKEVNEKMKVVFDEIKEQLSSVRNQIQYYNYSNNVNVISESYSSFDVSQ